MTKKVVYTSCTRLSCINITPSPSVILCLIDSALLAPVICPDSSSEVPYDFFTLEATLTKSWKNVDNCSNTSYSYVFSYDENLLSDPGTALIASQIAGVFCQGCLTDWVKEEVGNEISLVDNGDGTSALTTQHGCTYILNNDANLYPEYIVTNETTLIAAIAANMNMVVLGNVVLTAPRTITKSIRVINGGKFTTSGFILTLNGPFNCGLFQCFVTAANQVVFGANSILYVLMEWFGALGDGATDDTAAIQLALDTSVVNAANYFPVHVQGNKTYRMSTVNMPARGTLVSPMGRTSGGIFLANSASAMFVCPAPYSENNITFRGGFMIKGNGTAAACIDVGGASGLCIDGVSFNDATVAIKMTGLTNGINYIHRCRFAGTIPTCIQLGANALLIDIDECMFSSTSTNAFIYTDATWTGDNLHIKNCNFDAGAGAAYALRLIRLNNATPTIHAVIESSRFDGACSVANIYIGQFVYANILNNGISGAASPQSIICDGDECYIADNYLADKGITLSANSRFCVTGNQKFGGFAPHYTDAGTGNVILATADSYIRKGITANRPTLLATGQYGTLYLDTTLDADGKAIWWNGVAWVDATGAVV